MKKPLVFTLVLLPIAAIAAYFVVLYQLDLYDPAEVEIILAQLGSMKIVIWVSVLQATVYVAICSFVGYILSDKIGLMKPIRFEKTAIFRTLLLSLVFGIVFSLDYWTFGAWIPGVRESTVAGITGYGWVASVLYGGIIEEVMLRLFMMSLVTWLIWKIFYRQSDHAPIVAVIAANVISALLFASGHLPVTITIFGELSPIILLRCFLLNGGFGLLFGWLYRRNGIQYAMMSHALLHIFSKTIWLIFI